MCRMEHETQMKAEYTRVRLVRFGLRQSESRELGERT